MLGGGTFLVQNKVLNGAYINFVSAKNSNFIFGDRGFVAMGIDMDWGKEGEIITVESADIQTNSMKIFGYAYDAPEMKGLRDLFIHAKTAYLYRLNGGGTKAANDYATAKYAGTRGNALKLVIRANVDNEDAFDVITYLGDAIVDSQTVEDITDLVENNYLTFKTSVTLQANAGFALSGGTNGTQTALHHQEMLGLLEGYSFNILGCVSVSAEIKALYAAYVKRMRDDVGKKFQVVLHKYEQADSIGVISVENNAVNSAHVSDLVYFVSGIEAGCAVNKSCTNKIYNGEFEVNTDYTQTELKEALLEGKLMFHKVGDDVRILDDINTFVSTTVEMNDDFKSNQTIRVLDQIGNDIAALFNTKYLGEVPNDNAGRVALWSDIVTHHRELETLRAIENFDPEGVTVEKGMTKKSVVVTDRVEPVNAMGILYMTVIVE
ncbi:MAG: phage tail sheath family protein [Alphaproteobacteria bacterium]|nr:phage tail sheath family protein [Alphaproteobacteria bacterium]